MKLKFLSILLVLLLIFPFSGCSDTMDSYIYFELPDTPLTLDPQIASLDQELIVVKNIFEGLLRKDSSGKIVCGAAKSYIKKGLTYTFEIRKDAKWSNGEPLTANDFVFGLKRAVMPETKALYVSKLFSIAGAKDINLGKANTDSLGVKAIDKDTLTITLIKEDSLFEDTLTTSIAMPCNEEFFLECAGKYGLFTENIISNGSYRFARWRKDPFGIRLYRNKEYNGDFISKNAAVFITCDKEESALNKLQKNSIDMAFIDCSLTDAARQSDLETLEFQNICWFMTLGDSFTKNMRKALFMLVGDDVYKDSLKVGFSPADSLFPEVANANTKDIGLLKYDSQSAKKFFISELNSYKDKKFPTDVVLYYYDDGNVKNVVTDIVGHWQSSVSAFINIESVSESKLLLSQLTDHSYAMSIFPVRLDSTALSEYLKKFGVDYNGEKLSDIQTKILESYNILPIMFQNTVISHSKSLQNVSAELGNGYIDFSFIVKEE